jgi:4-hydroxybenzoate polyprenyltransferase
VVRPMLEINGFTLQMNGLNFFLLVMVTLLIAAAGYMINDYFDVKIDEKNKPGRMVVGRQVNKEAIYNAYYILNFVAIMLGFYVSYQAGISIFGVVFILVAGLLWFYSTSYKKQFLLGNLIVSALTALVPFMVPVFEIPLVNQEYAETIIQYEIRFDYILYWVAGFSFFAFLTTLIREIIKDAQDFEGDVLSDRQTLPIVLGMKATKVILGILLLALMASLIYVYHAYLRDKTTLIYMITVLFVPIGITVYFIIKARSEKEFKIASQIMKGIMVGGIFYSLIVSFILHQNM